MAVMHPLNIAVAGFCALLCLFQIAAYHREPSAWALGLVILDAAFVGLSLYIGLS